MAARVSSAAGFEPQVPVPLFSFEPGGEAILPYDVDSDGERFIVVSALPGESVMPVVVTGWPALVSE